MYPKQIVPDTFDVPTRVEVEGIVLTPINLSSWDKDVRAVWHLRERIIQNQDVEILNPGLYLPGNMLFGLSDACYLDKIWRLRASFTYGIMTPDEREELGCLYVYRTRKLGYDAEIVSWIRSEDLKPLGEKIYEFAESWIPEVWPFKNTTWPGRKISWQEWYQLPDKDPQNWPDNPPSYALIPQMLVPAKFEIPESIDSNRFRLVPLHLNMDSIAKHYEAYTSSVDHLKGTFGPDDQWPENSNFEEAIVDVGYFHFYWHTRSTFVYSIRHPDDSHDLGCIYVAPTHKSGYQAEIYIWVREGELESNLDEELFEFTQNWINDEWPFERVAWPGREISWKEWKSLPEWRTNSE